MIDECILSERLLVMPRRQDPLMLAIEGFVSDAEIETIVRLGSPLLGRSGIQEAAEVADGKYTHPFPKIDRDQLLMIAVLVMSMKHV